MENKGQSMRTVLHFEKGAFSEQEEKIVASGLPPFTSTCQSCGETL